MSVALPTREDSPPAEEPDTVPVTVIERRSGWGVFDFRELWPFRELLLFLIWRDVTIRYKQTAVGLAWAVLQPVAVMAVMSFALGRVAGSPDAATPYWMFVLCGLVPWTFFSAAVANSGMSVVNNQHLVTKVYFPRLLLPLSGVGLAGVDFLVAFAVLMVLVGAGGVFAGWSVLLVPVVVLVLSLIALGIGVFIAAVTVRYRDFRVIVPLALQLGMFLTPAIYDQNGLTAGAEGRIIGAVNPVNAVVANFRAAVIGGPIDWAGLGVAAVVGAVLFLAAATYFRRVERQFADVI